MTIDRVLELVQNWPFLAFALVLWKSERDARLQAEKRERNILRIMAEVKEEE